MISDRDIQRNNENQKNNSFIENLITVGVLERAKFQELQNLNEDEVAKGNYTSFEENLYALIKGSFECPISIETVKDPIALITHDANGKKVASIMSENSLKENLKIGENKAQLDPFNRQPILKLVTPEGINSFENYKVKNYSINLNANEYPSFFDLSSPKKKAIVAATMAITTGLGFLVAGPVGAIMLAAAGFLVGLVIASLSKSTDQRSRSTPSPEGSINNLRQNTPFFNRELQNNNQSNESTSGLPSPT